MSFEESSPNDQFNGGDTFNGLPQASLNTEAFSERKITIPPEKALPLQIELMLTYFFTDKDGKNIEEPDDKVFLWWVQKYGQAFREYCEANTLVSEKIMKSRLDIREKQEMATYIKNHPKSDEEIEEENKKLLEEYTIH